MMEVVADVTADGNTGGDGVGRPEKGFSVIESDLWRWCAIAQLFALPVTASYYAMGFGLSALDDYNFWEDSPTAAADRHAQLALWAFALICLVAAATTYRASLIIASERARGVATSNRKAVADTVRALFLRPWRLAFFAGGIAAAVSTWGLVLPFIAALPLIRGGRAESGEWRSYVDRWRSEPALTYRIFARVLGPTVCFVILLPVLGVSAFVASQAPPLVVVSWAIATVAGLCLSWLAASATSAYTSVP